MLLDYHDLLFRAADAVRHHAAAEASAPGMTDHQNRPLRDALATMFASVKNIGSGEFDPRILTFQIEDCEIGASDLSCAAQASLAGLRLVGEALSAKLSGRMEEATSALLRAQALLICFNPAPVIA